MRWSGPALCTSPTAASAVLTALLSAAVLWAPTIHAAPAPAPVALLPSVGSAKEDVRRDLDSTLRQALLDEDKVDLLSPVETREHVMSLAEMGLVCLPEDVACLVKLGIVAKVDLVLVPVGTASGKSKELDVEVTVIDVAKSAKVRAVQGHFAPSDTAQAAALVKKALGAGDVPKPRTATTSHPRW